MSLTGKTFFELGGGSAYFNVAARGRNCNSVVYQISHANKD